jgi:hypothetical protein
MSCTDLRIRRLGVRVPPSAPHSPQVKTLAPPSRDRHLPHLAAFWPHQPSRPPRRGVLPGQVTGLLYFDLLTRDHAVMAELRDFAFSGDVTISLAR